MKIFLFLLLSLTISAQASISNELTLYFIPSPKGMDWSSPKSVALSAIENFMSFDKRYIGHVFVEIKCGDTHELSGMTGKVFDPVRQLIVKGRGFGILYHSFEGVMEDHENIEKELGQRLEDGSVNFTRFLINSQQCQRITRYLNEFRENNVGRYYGLAQRPRFGEGAGCSAYAASFVNVLGIMSEEMRLGWSHSVLIPVDLIGPPVRDERVSFFKLITSGESWATKDQESKSLMFWDPDRMHQWVKSMTQKPDINYEVLKIGKSSGIVVDKSNFPVPESPIWLQHTDPNIQKQFKELTP